LSLPVSPPGSYQDGEKIGKQISQSPHLGGLSAIAKAEAEIQGAKNRESKKELPTKNIELKGLK